MQLSGAPPDPYASTTGEFVAAVCCRELGSQRLPAPGDVLGMDRNAVAGSKCVRFEHDRIKRWGRSLIVAAARGERPPVATAQHRKAPVGRVVDEAERGAVLAVEKREARRGLEGSQLEDVAPENERRAGAWREADDPQQLPWATPSTSRSSNLQMACSGLVRLRRLAQERCWTSHPRSGFGRTQGLAGSTIRPTRRAVHC